MQFRRATIDSPLPGVAPVEGQVAKCEECDGIEFIIFQIDGQDHPHFQCVECGVSYCQLGGECNLGKP